MRLLALSSLIALTACGTREVQLEVSTEPVQLEIAQPARPRPVDLADVKFRVVTADTLDAFIAEQSKLQENNNPVFIAISIKDYQALSLNLAELRRYIDQQNSIIVYYRRATAP
jgi:hypothetical protein